MTHGTRTAYNQGCRCPECRQSKADYRRTHRTSMFVIPPGMSRRHCQICGVPLADHELKACWREVR